SFHTPGCRGKQDRKHALRTVAQDMSLAVKLKQAYTSEPILALGHFVGPQLRAYLEAAAS
ncbi:hypothetical protein, partial [Comamonas kerstersii]|uniref:hypothetical protein n=1 Tax=Comamonas kerstersii TaxID=225992 RepID=UPI0026DCB0DE